MKLAEGGTLAQRLEKSGQWCDVHAAAAQERLNRLVWSAWRDRRSTVAIFEGWDAAGKGGAIRRVAAALDARLARVIPVAAASRSRRTSRKKHRTSTTLPGWCSRSAAPRPGYV